MANIKGSYLTTSCRSVKMNLWTTTFFVLFIGTLLVEALENILLGQPLGIYGTNLTDGIVDNSCITESRVNVTNFLGISANLGKEYSIKSISVYFKESNVSSLVIQTDNPIRGRSFDDRIPPKVVIHGQSESSFVNVYIHSSDEFTVCEIEAIGCEKGLYGENCTACYLPANCETCDVTNGSCYRCHSNFTGPECLQDNYNLVLGKPNQVYLASYSNNGHSYSLDPLLLTDGIIDKSLCQKMKGFPTTIVFSYQFSYSLSIRMINIYLLFENIQDDDKFRLELGAYEYGHGNFNWRGMFNLSSEEVYSIPFARNTYDVTMGITIVYPNISLSGGVYICEIEILGCLSGYYGTPCRPCDHSGCAANNCHPLDGSCVCRVIYYNVTSCPEGALCKPGWYGNYCDQRCSDHCNVTNVCYQSNGTCIGGCADGWMSDRCDQDGYVQSDSVTVTTTVLRLYAYHYP